MLNTEIVIFNCALTKDWNYNGAGMHFVTWFLKDMGSMGSSAAKEIDDSRMKRRMILVKVVALMIRWQSFRNLKGWKDMFILLKMTILKELVKCLQQAGIHIFYIFGKPLVIICLNPLSFYILSLHCHYYQHQQSPSSYLFWGPKIKNELASGIGTASSFNCRSAIGRGLGLSGISGSSSSSSPRQQKEVGISRDCSALEYYC